MKTTRADSTARYSTRRSANLLMWRFSANGFVPSSDVASNLLEAVPAGESRQPQLSDFLAARDSAAKIRLAHDALRHNLIIMIVRPVFQWKTGLFFGTPSFDLSRNVRLTVDQWQDLRRVDFRKGLRLAVCVPVGLLVPAFDQQVPLRIGLRVIHLEAQAAALSPRQGTMTGQ